MSAQNARDWVRSLQRHATAWRALDRALQGLLVISWLAVLTVGLDRLVQWSTGQLSAVSARGFLAVWSLSAGLVVLVTAVSTWATRPSLDLFALAADQGLELDAALLTAWEGSGPQTSVLTPLIQARVEQRLSSRSPGSIVPPVPSVRRLAALAAAGAVALAALHDRPWAEGADARASLRLVGPAKDVTLGMGQDVQIDWAGSSAAALPGGVELVAERADAPSSVPSARIARNLPVSGGMIWNTYGMKPGTYRIRAFASPVGGAPLESIAPGRVKIVFAGPAAAPQETQDRQSSGPRSGAGQGRPEPAPFPWQAPTPAPAAGPEASGGNAGGNSRDPGDEEGGPLMGDEDRHPGTFSDREVMPLLGEGPTRQEIVDLVQGLSESEGGGATAAPPQGAPELLQEYKRRAERALGRESYDAADRNLLKRYFDALLPEVPAAR